MEKQAKHEDGRGWWRVTFTNRDFPALVVPADTRNFAYRAAAIMAPNLKIKRVEPVMEAK